MLVARIIAKRRCVCVVGSLDARRNPREKSRRRVPLVQERMRSLPRRLAVCTEV